MIGKSFWQKLNVAVVAPAQDVNLQYLTSSSCYCLTDTVPLGQHIVTASVECLVISYYRSACRNLCLTRWLRRTRYLVLLQYCLVATYKLTRVSHICGQQLLSVLINFNATS